MSVVGSTPFAPGGGPSVEFVALLLLGRQRGYLTPDDIVVVFESAELDPGLIDAVIGRIRSEGIEWRDDSELDGPHLLSGAEPERPASASSATQPEGEPDPEGERDPEGEPDPGGGTRATPRRPRRVLGSAPEPSRRR